MCAFRNREPDWPDGLASRWSACPPAALCPASSRAQPLEHGLLGRALQGQAGIEALRRPGDPHWASRAVPTPSLEVLLLRKARLFSEIIVALLFSAEQKTAACCVGTRCSFAVPELIIGRVRFVPEPPFQVHTVGVKSLGTTRHNTKLKHQDRKLNNRPLLFTLPTSVAPYGVIVIRTCILSTDDAR